MNIKNIYFSEKNINILTKTIRKQFNIPESGNATCAKLLITQMNLIYEKNKSKIMRATNIPKCMQKLNQVALNKVGEMVKNKIPNTANIKVQKSPKSNIDNDDYNNYASITEETNGFYSADGSIGKNMVLIDNNNDGMNDKKNDLEEAYEKLLNEYDNDIYNINGNKVNIKKPEQIDFSLDGKGKTNNIFSNTENNVTQHSNIHDINYQSEDIHEIYTNNNKYDNTLYNNTSFNNTKNIISYTKYDGDIDERFAQMEMNKNIFGINRVYKQPISEIEERINDKKREIANKNGFDPELLITLSSEQIEQLLKKAELDDHKNNILKNLIQIQHTNDTPYNSNNIKKRNITIKSNECTIPQHFNNYKIQIEPLSNIQNITIVGESEFPLLKPIVDESHNILCIIYNNDVLPIEILPNDNYTLDEITHDINNALKTENIPIQIRVNEQYLVIIENLNNKHFDLDFRENSIGIFLGFQCDIYKNKSIYISESPHMFIERNYFMFIKEISMNAICEIQSDGKVKQLLNKIHVTNMVDTLTIQYHDSNDINSKFTEFYETPHEITFEIQYN